MQETRLKMKNLVIYKVNFFSSVRSSKLVFKIILIYIIPRTTKKIKNGNNMIVIFFKKIRTDTCCKP